MLEFRFGENHEVLRIHLQIAQYEEVAGMIT